MEKNKKCENQKQITKKKYEKPRFKIIKPGEYPTNLTTISASTNNIIRQQYNG